MRYKPLIWFLIQSVLFGIAANIWPTAIKTLFVWIWLVPSGVLVVIITIREGVRSARIQAAKKARSYNDSKWIVACHQCEVLTSGIGDGVRGAAMHEMDDVRLIKEIPIDRLRLISGNGKPPSVGDSGATDQAYTYRGKHMVLVYFISEDGSTKWEAEAYPEELGPLPESPSPN